MSSGESNIEKLVLENDLGARNPESFISRFFILSLAFLWAMFQLYSASPIAYDVDAWANETGLNQTLCDGTLNVVDFLRPLLEVFGGEFTYNCDNFSLVINSGKLRIIHLGFAVALCFLLYPAFKTSTLRRIPFWDGIWVIFTLFVVSFLLIWSEDIAQNSGNFHSNWVAISIIGVVLLLEATRRSLGIPLVILAIIFMAYPLTGESEIWPEVMQIKEKSVAKLASHQWLTSEGVFGVPLEVSASFVFLFVLFGALLDKAGAGNYFIKLAFSLLGHMRGGPAKAAVLSSGLTGMISGSSIANTVTTGTFTIPLMKRAGFSPEKAGAIEVAASVNGQIMPPVMGAAAFLMVSFTGLSFSEIVKYAFLPAVISYIALLYLVHLEALKAGMQPIEVRTKTPFKRKIMLWGVVLSSIIILSMIIGVVFGKESCFAGVCINGLKHYALQSDFIAEYYNWIVFAVFIIVYILLVIYASFANDLEVDDPSQPLNKLPKTKETAQSGYYFLLPIIVLIWCLMVEKYSPGLSAYWASIAMIFILLTHKILKVLFRLKGSLFGAVKTSLIDFGDGMVSGARNMISIGVATATAGIIVGIVTITGLGATMMDIVGDIAGNSVFILLLLTAIISIILGMGLPTTANYIVVSSIMAPILVTLGAENGLAIPLIAAHLFVFYYGIMADVTPPVGLASFAAAGISGSSPLKTGAMAFMYSLRTAILPFFFLFNPELILYEVDNIGHGIWIFIYAMIAIMLFSASIQGFMVKRCNIIERIILMGLSFMIFIPNIILPEFNPNIVRVICIAAAFMIMLYQQKIAKKLPMILSKLADA